MLFLKPFALSVTTLLLGGLLASPLKAEVGSLRSTQATPRIGQNVEPSNAPPKGRKALWASLGLTDTQKSQIQQIKANSRQQIEAVLTPGQKAQWQAAKSQSPRQKPDLNLSEDQKAKLKSIREQSKAQIDALLTPEQRQKYQELRQQWQQKRQERSTPNSGT